MKMKNFVTYFDDLPRRNATDDVEFVSGTVLVDSDEMALNFLGIADPAVRDQMKRFKNNSSGIAAMVNCYDNYIRETLKNQVESGLVQQSEASMILNERNRKVSAAYVMDLAKQMKEGKFDRISPQGLVFHIKHIDEIRYQRMLSDGQNRLLAAFVSRTVLRFHVQLTDDLRVFSLLDLGKKRQASTAVNNDLFEQIGPIASLIQRDMPYLPTLVLYMDPQKGESKVQLALFRYLKYRYVDAGGVNCDMLTALYNGIGSDLFVDAFSANDKGNFSAGFVGGMLRALIEAVETENVDAQRSVYAVIKQIAAMRRGDYDTRHAVELDRIEPYLSRIFGMNSKTRGHRDITTRIFHALFSSIVFHRKSTFTSIMDRLDRYHERLADRKVFNEMMSSKTKFLLDDEGNEIYLFKDIERDFADEKRNFETYRNIILKYAKAEVE